MSVNAGTKAVLITGAASGVGLETARRFAAAGMTVAINHLAEDPRGAAAIEALRAEGLEVCGAPGNVGDADGAAMAMEAALEGMGGRLDYLVNNAGTPGGKSFVPYDDLDALTEDFWQEILSVNLVSMFRMTRLARRQLSDAGGAVVNIASITGFGQRGSSIAYAASKAGVVNLTISLARALAPKVRVNAVAPGIVDSPWLHFVTQEQKASYADRTMLRRLARPSDIADAIVFLCCGTSYMTGQTVVVDGGLTHGG